MSCAQITTVTVTYNSAGTLPDAIATLRQLHDQNVARVVLVDNASADQTPQILQGIAHWAHVILGDKNVGFARGCNRGLQDVATPYTLFLNPDAVLGIDAARTLLAFMERTPGAGICGPAILQSYPDDPEAYQTAGDRPTPWSTLRRLVPGFSGALLRPIMPGTSPFRCEWVCGAAYLARTSMLRDLGGFDPRFFLYFEEMDLCLRAQRAGWETWAVGEALVTHAGAASAPRGTGLTAGCISRFYYPSRMYYFAKNHGLPAAAAAELGEIALLAAAGVMDVLRGRHRGRLRERLQSPVLRMPARVQ